MIKNIGKADKTIRILLAAVFIMLYLAGITSGIFGIILIVLAIIFVFTSLVRFCPLYLPFRINTGKLNRE